MDVVKREIDSLGGSVQVDSRPGKGSTIILKIPLTLAIIEGLLVRVSDEYFVLPLSLVEAVWKQATRMIQKAMVCCGTGVT